MTRDPSDVRGPGSRGPRVFNIPSDAPFLPSLARAILSGGFPTPNDPVPGPFELSQWTVLVPTRRAVGALRAAFLNAAKERALILPRIRPLGDIDEDEFAFAASDSSGELLTIPPAIPDAQLLFLLARLIDEWLAANAMGELARTLIGHPGQVFSLARSLIRLLDSFDTEEVGLDALGKLAGPDFAAHRQAMLDFLQIIRTRLPAELSALGLITRAKRRSLLLRAEAHRLASGPYARPVIAAGSTGTIPATANLLKVIASLPRGAVVLPGLDLTLDEESWQEVPNQESHPQYGLNRLLRDIGIDRRDTLPLPGVARTRPGLARLRLASELLRPVATSHRWNEALGGLGDAVVKALAGVEIIEAPDEASEALVAALILRSVVGRRGLTGSLITPDRRLARRVKAELGRWGIGILDSAGEPAARRPEGAFMCLIAELGASRCDASALAALLKHPLFRLGRTPDGAALLTQRLEIAVLRGGVPVTGIASLQTVCESRRALAASHGQNRHLHPAVQRLTAADWAELEQFIVDFTKAASPFLALTETNEPRPLSRYLHHHLALANELAAAPGEGERLWRGPGGEVVANLFAELLEHAERSPLLSPADYLVLIRDELEARPVREQRTGHPRISILGLLEARLILPDVVVLAGLNQGTWPPEPRSDPWLSRPMKEEIGLSHSERRIGLAAHDFMQNFAASEVYLTSARKIDGEPAVPSRFLLRLNALLATAGQPIRMAPQRWLHWSAELDNRLPVIDIAPAMPAPAVHLRPRQFSVTRIGRLIENPYGIFAEQILGLRELDPITTSMGAAERGSAVHEALRSFCETARPGADENAYTRLLEYCRKAFARHGSDAAGLRLWWPRFQRTAQWFIDRDHELLSTVERRHFEVSASAALIVGTESFSITARADRIDVLKDGSLRIIDYKTGILPSPKKIASGHNPQLALEAWLAAQGAFEGLAAAAVSEMLYVRLGGGIPPGEVRAAKLPARLAAQASVGLQRLLADYLLRQTPYLALVDRASGRTGSIRHLARNEEWQVT